MPEEFHPSSENPVTLFAETNFRNQRRRFGIRLDDRRRHMYILGKTGMGKTTLLENMILSDIYAGHGVAYIDPHGDTAERILDYIPSHRLNDVVYFNPADMDYPVGFNILQTDNDEQKHLVASGLMGVFKKIWPDVWSARMEYILLNCVLALLDFPGATLLGINRLLVDKDYRQRVIEKIRDPIVKTFWVAEFSSWSEKYATEAIAPVQNKVGQFLSASIIRNIVAQVKSTIDPRDIMDNQKIFIVNLSKGRIGEDNMRLLGGMIVTKLQLAAMERVDIPEVERKDFFLYVDEFQNFATQSFANILSEARKYRLCLILAHQYVEQLEEEVRDGVFGNVGTLVIFRVGAKDAEFMETEFTPTFLPEDLTNIPKYQVYLKLMVDGVSTAPFSATTLAPIAERTASTEKVIRISRERYAVSRKDIEEKVLRWTGMMTDETPTESAPPVEGMIVESMSQAGVEYPKILTEEEQEAAPLLQTVTSKPAMGAEAVAVPEMQEEKEPTEYLKFSPERLAAIQASRPAPKKKKPMFKHICSRCGKEWEMPIQLDPSRPMYCSECLPLIRDEKKIKGTVLKAAVRGKPQGGIVMDEEEVKEESDFGKAMEAIEHGRKIQTNRQKPPEFEPNRPRIIVSDPEKYEDLVDPQEKAERSELLEAIEERRGSPVERRKKAALPDEEIDLTPLRVPVSGGQTGQREQRTTHDPSTPLGTGSRGMSAATGIRTGDMGSDPEKKRRRKRKRNRRDGGVASGANVETFFQEAEQASDQKREESHEQEADIHTVFRPPSQSGASRSPSGAAPGASQGPRTIKPGERISFDD